MDASDKFEAHRLTELEVGYLYQIAMGRPTKFDSTLGFSVVNLFDGGERITTKLPDAFRDLLAVATAEESNGWAHAWSKSELGWPKSDCSEVIKGLQCLAKRAQAANKSLFLWNCI